MVTMKYNIERKLTYVNVSKLLYNNVNHKSATTAKVSCTISGFSFDERQIKPDGPINGLTDKISLSRRFNISFFKECDLFECPSIVTDPAPSLDVITSKNNTFTSPMVKKIHNSQHYHSRQIILPFAIHFFRSHEP